jgi:hypothetical protein
MTMARWSFDVCFATLRAAGGGALIYQHATSERDREIAAEVSRRAIAARQKAKQEAKNKAKNQGGDDPDDGAAGGLVPAG